MTEQQALGEKLFTMVVVADTHLSEQDMQSNSPFPVNRLANGRMKHVVQDINALQPDFVINLGDLIHPVPGVPQAYHQAVERFLEQTSELTCPHYLVPGNHDVGDKPIDWAPAGTVCDDYLALWEEYFGAHFYAFEQHDCHFLVVNAQIINTGLEAEQQQRQWLEQYLAEHEGGRFFINIHYPPFLTEPEEPEHYDNIAEPGRSWLLQLLEQYSVEALFAGHVHNFWYNRHSQTDCYLLPSTAFVRQDYSEMFRVPPQADEEHGRNELAKLGYLLVNVYENGHACQIVRTYGQLAESPDQTPAAHGPSVHPLEHQRAPLGVDLRQSWAEVLEIPPSGGLDEFIRKPVRNDYPLLALWEMGIKQLRVPLHDLADPQVRRRMSELVGQGHQFTAFSVGVPTADELRLLESHQQLLVRWELAYADSDLNAVADLLEQRCNDWPIAILLSRLRNHDDVWQQGERYYHVINHGFSERDEARMSAILERLKGVISGFVIRLAWQDSPWQLCAELERLAESLKVQFSVQLRLAGENPAEQNCDDEAIARRIASAQLAALASSNISVFVDAFADNDRGYFVKHGLVDRRYNPRLACRVVRHLYGSLASLSHLQWQQLDTKEAPGWQLQVASCGDKQIALLLPSEPSYLTELPVTLAKAKCQVRSIDLDTGASREWQNSANTGIALSSSQLYRVPSLFIIDSPVG